jgi:hypothetical protein
VTCIRMYTWFHDGIAHLNFLYSYLLNFGIFFISNFLLVDVSILASFRWESGIFVCF